MVQSARKRNGHRATGPGREAAARRRPPGRRPRRASFPASVSQAGPRRGTWRVDGCHFIFLLPYTPRRCLRPRSCPGSRGAGPARRARWVSAMGAEGGRPSQPERSPRASGGARPRAVGPESCGCPRRPRPALQAAALSRAVGPGREQRGVSGAGRDWPPPGAGPEFPYWNEIKSCIPLE